MAIRIGELRLRRRFLWAVSACLLLPLFSLPVDAQRLDSSSVASLPPAVEARVWRADPYASPRFLRGRLLALTTDSISVRSTLRNVVVTLPRDSVGRVEIAQGRESRRRNMKVGAGIGSVAGAVAGFAFSRILTGLCESPGCAGSTRHDIAGAVIFAVPGALTGMAIGSLFPGRTIWKPLSLTE